MSNGGDTLTGGNIEPRGLEEEMKSSYLDYAMSVIVGRALPDARDGLKPVHRRVLFSMNENGLQPTRPYRKSAFIVGEVMGKYHPHGDTAIYDTLVRLAQDFAMRYPLADPQGNFGSIDDDPAAAMRYTEARLSRIATEMLRDLDSDTAEFVQEKKLTGISDIQDHTDKRGMRLVIELKRDAVPKVVLNQLYKHTPMQTTFGVNMVALVDGVPRTLSLREALDAYVRHQREVVVRRTKFELSEKERRAHILEGLLVALDNLDEVNALIRSSRDPETARDGLVEKFELTLVQAEAILQMTLRRLTALEANKIKDEHRDVVERIKELREILGDESNVLGL